MHQLKSAAVFARCRMLIKAWRPYKGTAAEADVKGDSNDEQQRNARNN